VHGIIFAELKRYVEARMGVGAWAMLLDEAGLHGQIYLSIRSYDDGDALRLINAAARITEHQVAEILEDFGEFITPSLLNMFGGMMKPEWRTLDFLERVEENIHRVVRMRNPGASPPQISYQRRSKEELVIHYSSQRKLCALARGLIHGVAQHYGEEIRLFEQSCMLRGAPNCTLVVRS